MGRRLHTLAAALALHAGLAGAQAVAPSIEQTMPGSILPSRLPIGTGRASDDWSVRALASDFEANDAVPVRGLDGDWHDYHARNGRNVAIQSSRAEIAASRGAWELAVVGRFDASLSGPRSTWDAVRAYQHKQTPADGSRFLVDARERGVFWTGLRGAHTWDLRPGSDHGLQFTAAITALSMRRTLATDLAGHIDYTRAGGYAFDVAGQRQDSMRHWNGYGIKGTTGEGWSSDIGLMWRPNATRFVNLSAVDLFSRTRVNGVSTQQATLSSATNSIDANGYLAYQPLVNGRYLSSRVTRRLDRQWSAAAGTQVELGGYRFTAGARLERTGELNLPALWATLPLAAGMGAQVDADLRFHTLGLGLVSRYGSVMLRTRSLPIGESRAFGWQASAMLPL